MSSVYYTEFYFVGRSSGRRTRIKIEKVTTFKPVEDIIEPVKILLSVMENAEKFDNGDIK